MGKFNFDLAPILLFTYKRLDTLIKTVESLKMNSLAKSSILYIFSDGPKSDEDYIAVDEIRKYIQLIDGFKEVRVVEGVMNIGLANSIINGVTSIIKKYGKVIVVEDDLVTSNDFLTFMNQCLDFYQDNEEVFSISGYIFNMSVLENSKEDVFFTRRHCSWGWAMWENRWNRIDWDVSDFSDFLSSSIKRKQFDMIGEDLSTSLIKQQNGKINSWAIRCNYHQFKEQTYTVYPTKSKVINIGFGEGATHTIQKFIKYKAILSAENKSRFNLPSNIVIDKELIKNFTSKYSKKVSLYYFLLNTLFSFK